MNHNSLRISVWASLEATQLHNEKPKLQIRFSFLCRNILHYLNVACDWRKCMRFSQMFSIKIPLLNYYMNLLHCTAAKKVESCTFWNRIELCFACLVVWLYDCDIDTLSSMSFVRNLTIRQFKAKMQFTKSEIANRHSHQVWKELSRINEQINREYLHSFLFTKWTLHKIN